MADLLAGTLKPTNYTIIDCRYDYEFKGGHIRGATNFKTISEIEKAFINSPSDDPTRILIFHCEFSSHRGPTLYVFVSIVLFIIGTNINYIEFRCRHLRSRDRQLNQLRYPELNYPQIYVLEGGFKKFFNEYPVIFFSIVYN